jgi:peptidoglycan/xylan/chitin deacetylase (PgdA/CDA1 family)
MRKIIKTAGCIIALLLLPEISALLAQPSLKFVIRVDDILSRNTTILPRSITPLQDSVAARGGVLTWGVMPHRLIEGPNLDGQLAAELTASAALGHEISLHGYIHICQRCNQSSHEMYCTFYNQAFTEEEQARLIKDGIDLLDEHTGIRPVSFIPPGHVSDEITWKVLPEFDIPYISTTKPQDFLNNELFNLPPDSEYTWALTSANYEKNLRDALADIRQKAEEKQVYTLLLHDPFIRSGYEGGITIRWIGELLDSLNTYYGEGIEYLTLTDAARLFSGETTGTVPDHRPVAHFSLDQNYPNPFNPQTEIRFTLDRAARVSLAVYDVAGAHIRTLNDGPMNAGSHRVSFNAGDLPSGVYIYSLRAGGVTQSRKMTLIK